MMSMVENSPGENLRAELELKTPEEVAAAFGVTPTTLAQWRSKGYGPAYAPLGKAIFYPTYALKDWISLSLQAPRAKTQHYDQAAIRE